MPLHAQAQCFQTLSDEECVEWRDGGTKVAQQLHTRLKCVGRRAQIGEHHAVVARVGGGESGMATLGPVEGTSVDDHAADCIAVSTKVFGGRVHHDVGPVCQRLDQIGGGDGVVDDQRDACRVRDLRQAGDVENVVLRVGDRLGEQRLGIRGDGVAPRLQIIGVFDEGSRDAQSWQRVVQQIVGASVQARAGDDVVAGLCDVHDRQGRRRLSGGK
ncbi:Uncharacterised protein [Mycobacteroides abscessus subsp. abscessus]|nr:Uncharacterised protein [Mycobacteroides abscessus subsp. abscessus]